MITGLSWQLVVNRAFSQRLRVGNRAGSAIVWPVTTVALLQVHDAKTDTPLATVAVKVQGADLMVSVSAIESQGWLNRLRQRKLIANSDRQTLLRFWVELLDGKPPLTNGTITPLGGTIRLAW
jgi:hypothetical protein